MRGPIKDRYCYLRNVLFCILSVWNWAVGWVLGVMWCGVVDFRLKMMMRRSNNNTGPRVLVLHGHVAWSRFFSVLAASSFYTQY